MRFSMQIEVDISPIADSLSDESLFFVVLGSNEVLNGTV